MAATDFARQFLAEHGQLLAFWRAHMRRENSINGRLPPLRSKENQLRQLRGGQPRETATIVKATKSQAAVAVNAVPTQVGDLQGLAAH
jgi:hypothetical protein